MEITKGFGGMRIVLLLTLATACLAAQCQNPYEDLMTVAINNTLARMEACALDPASVDGVQCACRLYTLTRIVRAWSVGNMSLWQIQHSQYLCPPGLSDFLFNDHNPDATNERLLLFLEAALKSRGRL